MAKLVGRLKSLKSLKQLIVDKDQEEDCSGCIQTPTDSCVRHAEASIHAPPDAADAAPQGGAASGCREGQHCIQTPTATHVADAEADVADSPGGSQQSSGSASGGGGIVSALARRLSRVRTFHGSYDELDGGSVAQQRRAVSFSASVHSQRGGRPGRRRSLHGSASQPELAGALSGVSPTNGEGTPAHSPAITVLGREARRRSERRRVTIAGDEAPRSPASPSQPEAGAAAPEASGRSATMRALYSLVAPLRSPFADIPPLGGVERSVPSASGGASSSQPDQAPLPSPGSTRERLMLRRKISSTKLIVSTGPLEQRPGDIMLAPGVAELIVSTGPLEQQPGDIMLAPGVAEFAIEALRGAGAGGHYTGEIEFSGRSARVARRLSSHRASGVQAAATAVAAA